MKLLIKEIPDIKLYIVGECYENEQKYDTIINDNKLRDNIIWINEYIITCATFMNQTENHTCFTPLNRSNKC